MELVPQHTKEVMADKHELNRQISIWLDEYEDIFSDFDPRVYAERALSDDFIGEVRKVTREDDYEISEMKLLVPEKNRKPELESTIIKRLHTFFRRGFYYRVRNTRIERGKGILMLLAGAVMMVLAFYLSNEPKGFLINLLRILFEPAGWFFVWTGMDTIFFLSGKKKEELDFYGKMAKTKVTFNSF